MYHASDKRFASAVPYASIIVELDDAPGALLPANLLDAEYTEAEVGRLALSWLWGFARGAEKGSQELLTRWLDERRRATPK